MLRGKSSPGLSSERLAGRIADTPGQSSLPIRTRGREDPPVTSSTVDFAASALQESFGFDTMGMRASQGASINPHPVLGGVMQTPYNRQLLSLDQTGGQPPSAGLPWGLPVPFEAPPSPSNINTGTANVLQAFQTSSDRCQWAPHDTPRQQTPGTPMFVGGTHTVDNVPDLDERLCKECNRRFHSFRALERHLIQAHKRYHCPSPNCKKTFKTNDSRKRHIRINHNDDSSLRERCEMRRHVSKSRAVAKKASLLDEHYT